MKTKIRCSLLLLSMSLITFFSLSGIRSLDKLFEDKVTSLAETLSCSFAPANCQAGGCGARYCKITLSSDESLLLVAGHSAEQDITAPNGEYACCWKDRVVQKGQPTFYRPRALTFKTNCCN